MAEAFSALLLRAWGLDVPQPFLVIAEEGGLHFASADAAYPSLKHRFSLGNLPEGEVKTALTEAACLVVAGLSQTPLALVADEAIDNRDRNLGNVLWDGASAAWIDHELSLGLADHLSDDNKLAIMVNLTGQSGVVRQASIAAWMLLDREAPNAAAKENADAQALAALVSARLAVLGNRLLARFPAPADLLFGL